MSKFKQHINVTYPPNNEIIFEEWFDIMYSVCKTDRELIPVYFTSYWVNNNYGNDLNAKKELQEFIDSLDKNKKWFCICQYDDGVMVDWKGLDVLEFNMSKNVGVQIPLLCQPHPYNFEGGKKYFASFVGSKTHPIREELEKLKNEEDYYISFEPHSIESYCKILYESVFSLCPRGYGINSFKVCESLQFGAIPVIISDEFVVPYGISLIEFCVLLKSERISELNNCLKTFTAQEMIEMQSFGNKRYEKYYTYESNYKLITGYLENEYHLRESKRKNAVTC